MLNQNSRNTRQPKSIPAKTPFSAQERVFPAESHNESRLTLQSLAFSAGQDGIMHSILCASREENFSMTAVFAADVPVSQSRCARRSRFALTRDKLFCFRPSAWTRRRHGSIKPLS
jgi:hypothetical protein